jgi:ketosteroid isomerase-like protein
MAGEKMYKLREKIAELEHKQWMEWSRHLADVVDISQDRLNKWSEYWSDYKFLSEQLKDLDRKWADKILALPELQEAIKGKAKYDRLFEALKVVEECKHKVAVIDNKALRSEDNRFLDCISCNGTGKVDRALTEEEKAELMTFVLRVSNGRIELKNPHYLDSGVKVEVVK